MSLYHAILGEAFDTLHPNVRRAHEAPLRAEGTFDVVHGTHPCTRMLVTLMKLPAAGRHVPVALSVVSAPARTATEPSKRVRRAVRGGGLRWDRRIGATPLSTHQYADRGLLVEEAGLGRMVFSLRAANGCLVYEHAALRVLFVLVPPVLSPRVRACVSPDPEGWRVDVRVEWRGHLICEYGGRMRPSGTAPSGTAA